MPTRHDALGAWPAPHATFECEDSDARPYNAIIPAEKGLRLSAEIWPAAGRETKGVVVFVHGFCGNRNENGLFDALAAGCTEKGLAAVLYDWRGIGTSEGDFPATSLDDHVADFQHVLKWTATQFGSDLRALSAIGFSLGAAIVGSALGRRRQLSFRSLVYLSPAVRPRISMWPRYDTPDIRRELKRHGVVEKPGSSVLLGQPILDSLQKTDLGEGAFDVHSPLLVCHGSADTRIDCGHTRDLVALRSRRRAAPDAFRYEEFPGASHSFRPDEAHWKGLASTVSTFLSAPRGRNAAPGPR